MGDVLKGNKKSIELLLIFKSSKDRNLAFGALLDRGKNNVYKCDNSNVRDFPDVGESFKRGLILYSRCPEGESSKKIANRALEEIKSYLPVQILDYKYKPISNEVSDVSNQLTESRIGDIEIICDEVRENNKNATEEDLVSVLKTEMNISEESARGFVKDYLSNLNESKSREKYIEVNFPIPVNEKGRIRANDAKKILKELKNQGVLRVGRTYFVKDSEGNETCWDLRKDTFDSYVLDCEITEVNGEEVDFYNALYFSKGKNGLVDFEWEAHKVESMKNNKDRIKESLELSKDVRIDSLDYYSEDIEEVLDEDDGIFVGTLNIKINISYDNPETGKTEYSSEIWSVPCKGHYEGESPVWDECDDDSDAYFREYEKDGVSSLDYAMYSHFWDYADNNEELNKKISDAVTEFAQDWIVSQYPLRENKMKEALQYRFRIILEQPEGSNYRLTNSNTLKFKTREEAEEKLNQMNKYMGDRLASKGLSLKIEEIQPKERKKRGSATDNPLYENPFKVGDIITANVGYTQILPEFWEITSVGKSTVEVKKLKSKIVSPDNWGQSGYKIPEEGVYDKDYDGNEITTRLQVKLPKFPMYYNQSEEDYERRIKEDPMDVYYIWGQGHFFKKWNGEPQVWDTYD